MKQKKTEFKYPPPIPGFSCLEMKRQIQEKIYEKTKHMTSKERMDYIKSEAMQFQKELSQKED